MEFVSGVNGFEKTRPLSTNAHHHRPAPEIEGSRVTDREADRGVEKRSGRLGSLAGPLLSAALQASGRNAKKLSLDTLPSVLACGVCGWVGSRIAQANA